MIAVVSVLLIEDEFSIREGLATFLADVGHSVDSCANGMDGLKRAIEGDVDLVVLDLGLPDVDGSEVLKLIRAVSTVPVIVATARDDEAEIVRILENGADDYVVKPFSGAQLHARIQAVLRRGGVSESSEPIRVGALEIDPERRSAMMDGVALDLTRKEFDLLRHLVERTGVVVSKRDLMAEVWRQPYGGADKTVDVHLSVLRRKLGESAAEPRYLRTVHGVGVKIVDPDT